MNLKDDDAVSAVALVVDTGEDGTSLPAAGEDDAAAPEPPPHD